MQVRADERSRQLTRTRQPGRSPGSAPPAGRSGVPVAEPLVGRRPANAERPADLLPRVAGVVGFDGELSREHP